MRRRVPLFIRLHIYLNSKFSLMILGALVLVALVSNHVSFDDLSEKLTRKYGEFAQGKGVVTNKYEVYKDKNRKPVYNYDYDFEYSGSVMTGSSLSGRNDIKKGDEVAIMYAVNNPSVHHIKGMVNNDFGFWAYIPVAISVVVILFSLFGMTGRSRNEIKFYQNCYYARGKITEVRVEENYKQEEIRFVGIAYEEANRQRKVANAESKTDFVADDQCELLYIPGKLNSVKIVDDLPLLLRNYIRNNKKWFQ